MNTKHTPGPWLIGHADGKTPMRVYSQAGTLIADCDGGSPSDVKMANAQLIAAAPELAEALRECVNALHWGAQEAEYRKGVPRSIIGGMRHHAQRARAALTKAGVTP